MVWIYEKFVVWSDSGGEFELVLICDEMFDDIMFYWFINSVMLLVRFYWENVDFVFNVVEIVILVGVMVFFGEIYRVLCFWVEWIYCKFIYWNEVDCGGYFVVFE